MPTTTVAPSQLRERDIPNLSPSRGHGFGYGLSLSVSPGGVRAWYYRYRVRDPGGAWIARSVRLGVWPDVSLLEARALAAACRAEKSKGIDPRAKRKSSQMPVQVTQTFAEVFQEWYESHKYVKGKPGRWSQSYSRKFLRMAQIHILGRLGKTEMQHMTATEVLNCASGPCIVGKIETGHRCLSAIERVFDYWRPRSGWRGENPARGLTKNLEKMPAPEHFPAILDEKELGHLLRAVDSYKGDLPTIDLLRVSPYMAVRPSEIRPGRWEEIDFETGTWTVPAIRVKQSNELKQSGNDKVIPLSKQVVSILKSIKERGNKSPHIFASQVTSCKGRPISENTLNTALARLLGPRVQTAHGLRATFRTIAEEKLGIDERHLESALGHQRKDPLRGAYRRVKYHEEKAQALQRWADYLDTLRGYPPPELSIQ